MNAIFPADRLAPRDRIYENVNADYYRDHPEVSSGWTWVRTRICRRCPTGCGSRSWAPARPAPTLCAPCCIGACAHVTVLDRLPTPGGLVRAGAAPHDPSTKDVMKTSTCCTGIRMSPWPPTWRSVTVPVPSPRPSWPATSTRSSTWSVRRSRGDWGLQGRTCPVDVGERPRRLVQRGPGAQAPRPLAEPGDAGTGRAVVVRHLATWRSTSLASWCRRPRSWPPPTSPTGALDLLRRQNVHEVVILGRRGQDAAAYTDAEYRALSVIPGVTTEVYSDGEYPDLSGPADPENRRIVSAFHSVPVAADGDGRRVGDRAHR
ncbi:MAG: hypothetical protein QM658_09575 [Gordonia sp. (in: high G+C Gram-positive bacteria)]